MDALTFWSLCKLRHHVCSRTQQGSARLPTHDDGEIRVDLPLLFFTSPSHCAQRTVMEIRSNPRGFHASGSTSSTRNSDNGGRSASSSHKDRSRGPQTPSKLSEFIPVHTPDRPTHPATDIPSDEECYAILEGIQAHNIARRGQQARKERRVATWSVRGEAALHELESPIPMPSPAQRRVLSTENSPGKLFAAVGRMVGIKDIIHGIEDHKNQRSVSSPRGVKDSPSLSSVLTFSESSALKQSEVTTWPGSAAAETFRRMRQQISLSPESQHGADQPGPQTWSFKGPTTRYRDQPVMLPSPPDSLLIPPVPPSTSPLSKQALSVYSRESVYPDALTPTRWKAERGNLHAVTSFTGHASNAAPNPSTLSEVACSTHDEQVCRLCRRPGTMGSGALCLRCESSYLPVPSGVFGDGAHAESDSDSERGRGRQRPDYNEHEKPFSLDPPPARRRGLGRMAKTSPRRPRAQREDSSREVSPTPARVGFARGISIKAAMQSPKKIKLVSPGLRPGTHDSDDNRFPAFPRTTPGESVLERRLPIRDTSAVRKAESSSRLRAGEVLHSAPMDAQEEDQLHSDWTVDWEGFDYYFQLPDSSDHDDAKLDAAAHRRQLSNVEENRGEWDGEEEVPALEPSPISPILSRLCGRERTRTLKSEQQPAIRLFRSPEPAFF